MQKVLLPKSKLNSKEALISKALIDLVISNDEFALTLIRLSLLKVVFPGGGGGGGGESNRPF